MPLQKRREEMQLKYWARSSCHGENLPINSMTQPHVIYDTQRKRLKRNKAPYNISVQDLIKKHDLEKIKIQPIKYKKKQHIQYYAKIRIIKKKSIRKKTSNPESKRITEKYLKKQILELFKNFYRR